ncbi:hypothetical protein GGR55DRAFT_674604 [Xylaria sp. FL0064]|nr:hypothetical protein GGR55DRAFT_674604 [Xylaria sp. FL0064]
MVVILAAVSVAMEGGSTQGQGSSSGAAGSSTVKTESSPAPGPSPPPPTTSGSRHKIIKKPWLDVPRHANEEATNIEE